MKILRACHALVVKVGINYWLWWGAQKEYEKLKMQQKGDAEEKLRSSLPLANLRARRSRRRRGWTRVEGIIPWSRKSWRCSRKSQKN